MHMRVGKKRLLPFRKVKRMRNELVEPKADHDRVQQQINTDQRDGDSDRFFEAAQKDHAEDRNQRESHADLMFQHFRSERILDDVSGRVSPAHVIENPFTPEMFKHPIGLTSYDRHSRVHLSAWLEEAIRIAVALIVFHLLS